MASGKAVVMASTAFIAVSVGTAVFMLKGRQDLGPPTEFIEQMRKNPQCRILGAGNSGVRRHALAALLTDHGDWGVAMAAVSESPGPIHISGAGLLPDDAAGHKMSYVELAWPPAKADGPVDRMEGIQILCRDDLAVNGWPIKVPVVGEKYHTKSMLMPGERVVLPATAEPLDFGEGAKPDLEWRTRCWVDEVGSLFYRCEIDAADPNRLGHFIPQVTYRKWAQNIQGQPALKFDGHIESATFDAEAGVTVNFAVALDMLKLEDSCLASKAYQLEDGALTLNDDCETQPLKAEGKCVCEPPAMGQGEMECRAAEGENAVINQLCALTFKVDGFDSISLSNAYNRN